MLTIVKHPNETLKTKCEPVVKGDQETINVLREMTAYVKNPENGASGLALPQVGINKNGFVMKTADDKVLIVINPRFLKRGKLYTPDFAESCLSVEDKEAYIQRYDSVFMQYMDVNFKLQTIQLKGYRAVIAQHEYDHLQGILFVDKINNH